MSETPRDARGLLDAFGESHAGAYALARVVSLAARVEPALVRRARLELLPHLGAGDEADLWFGPLVQARSPLAVVFSPEVATQLRLRLAEDQRMLRRAWEVSRRVHAQSSPVILLEEEVTYLALSDEPDAAERVRALLMSAARAMVEGDGRGIAQWALRALPRLPERARSSEEAWALAVGAGARLGGRRILEGEAPDSVPRGMLRWVLPEEHKRARVGVRLLDAGVEFSEPPAEGAHVLEVPKTDPLLLEVVWGGGAESRQVTLRPGQTLVVETGPAEEVSVATPTGETFSVRREYEFDVFVGATLPLQSRLVERLRGETWQGRPLRVAARESISVHPFTSNWSQQLSGEAGNAAKSESLRQRRASRKVVEEVEEYDLKVLLARRAANSPGGDDDDPRVIRVYTKGGELSVDLSPYVNVAFSDESRFEQSYRKLLALIKDEPYTEPPEAPAQKPVKPVRVFPISARKDEPLVKRLYDHLDPLKDEGLIEMWDDTKSLPLGEEWRGAIDRAMESSDLFLMFLSPGFLSSSFVSAEVERARAVLAESGHVRVVPILLEPCDWQRTWPGTEFETLPRDGRPVASWPNADEALAQVVEDIRAIVGEVAASKEAEKSHEASDSKRVFISHSATDRYSLALLDRLKRALQKAGFGYFDADPELSNDIWRQDLRDQIVKADAAVVLLSESALKSQWVLNEVTALASRQQSGESLLLIPVLLEGVMPRAVDESPVGSYLRDKDLLLARSTPTATARRIVEALTGLDGRGPSKGAYFEMLAGLVAERLRHVPEEFIRRETGAGAAGAAPAAKAEGSAREALARRIVRGGLYRLEDNLRPLLHYLGGRDAQDILRLVAPTWVSPEAAAAVTRVAALPPGRRALCVNCARPFTARMYVERAGESPEPWHAVQMSSSWEEESGEVVLAELRAALRASLGLDAEDDPKLLAAQLERHREPFFVIFPEPLPPPQLVESVKSAFPTLTLFLMAGETLPEPHEFPRDYAEMIHPPLGPGEEERAFETYETLTGVFAHFST